MKCHVLPFLSVGKEVDIHDAAKVLQDMGIELTDSQLSKIVNNVPVDGKCFPSEYNPQERLIVKVWKLELSLSACLPDSNK